MKGENNTDTHRKKEMERERRKSEVEHGIKNHKYLVMFTSGSIIICENMAKFLNHLISISSSAKWKINEPTDEV